MEGIFRKQNSPLAVRFSLPIQARAVSLGPACQSLQKTLTSRKRRCSRGSSGHRCAFFVAPAPGRSVPDEACGPARSSGRPGRVPRRPWRSAPAARGGAFRTPPDPSAYRRFPRLSSLFPFSERVDMPDHLTIGPTVGPYRGCLPSRYRLRRRQPQCLCKIHRMKRFFLSMKYLANHLNNHRNGISYFELAGSNTVLYCDASEAIQMQVYIIPIRSSSLHTG